MGRHVYHDYRKPAEYHGEWIVHEGSSNMHGMVCVYVCESAICMAWCVCVSVSQQYAWHGVCVRERERVSNMHGMVCVYVCGGVGNMHEVVRHDAGACVSVCVCACVREIHVCMRERERSSEPAIRKE